jgi:hypothetical protein
MRQASVGDNVVLVIAENSLSRSVAAVLHEFLVGGCMSSVFSEDDKKSCHDQINTEYLTIQNSRLQEMTPSLSASTDMTETLWEFWLSKVRY